MIKRREDASPPATPDDDNARRRSLIGGGISSDSSDEEIGEGVPQSHGRASPIRRSYESKYREQARNVDIIMGNGSLQRLRSALRPCKTGKSFSEMASVVDSTNSPRSRRVKFRDELGPEQNIATYRYFVKEKEIYVNSDTTPELVDRMVTNSQCCSVS
uniref:Uncharacterized protein n=1 Tax=Lotharella globosa TaxID=91324 RepID=A0A7S3Z810_9EUKA|mmetsp:Transcript_7029/g.13751  ORF Transcript_7029/g.13751 Transcript_7029/m.13751 type:complete len:159 (+) Transcript_7029:34-510(+)